MSTLYVGWVCLKLGAAGLGRAKASLRTCSAWVVSARISKGPPDLQEFLLEQIMRIVSGDKGLGRGVLRRKASEGIGRRPSEGRRKVLGPRNEKAGEGPSQGPSKLGVGRPSEGVGRFSYTTSKILGFAEKLSFL